MPDQLVPDALPPLHRPGSTRYTELINYLARAKVAEESGKDRLEISLSALVQVIEFLDADPEVLARDLTRPLAALVLAVRDFSGGGKPDLLLKTRSRKRGAPTNTSFDTVRATIAAALSVLIKNGRSRNEAAKFVVDELHSLRVKTPSGRRISERLVLQWRDEIGGRASEVAQRRTTT